LVTVKTIGYGGKKPEDFFRELESMEPDVVVDVRENPYRAYLGAYTKPQLERRLGVRYTWIRELGNRTRSMPPILVDEERGLKALRELAEIHRVLVLLCAEKDEAACHRGYVKMRLEEHVDRT
jgi:uncharacterized protein (DUF488 family)